jgi:hypothetical protein
VLLVLGVTALRRQTAREFPDAQSGDTMQAIRARRHDATPAAVSPTVAPNGGRVAELERLAVLHQHGSLTDEEFAAEKAVLQNSG